MVPLVGDVDVAHEIHRDPAGKEKGAVIAAVAAPLHQRGTVPLKLLDAGVAGIGNIDVALRICGDAPWHVEFTHLRSAPGKPKLAPGMHTSAVGIKLLYPVVAAVGDIDFAIRPRGKPARIIKETFLRIRF